MVKTIYAVFDSVADTFAPPFTLNNDAEALRGFAGVAANPDTAVHNHPQDFHLYRLGTYDVRTGVITPDTPTRMCSAHEILRPNNPDQEVNVG